MSWVLTGIIAEKRVGSPTQRLVLLTMASRANDDGTGVYASFATMARDCELSRPTVKRMIKDLEDAGLVRKIGERQCANGHTNDYTVDVAKLRALPPLKESPVQREPGSTRPRVKRVNPVHSEPPTRFSLTPKPILETKKTTSSLLSTPSVDAQKLADDLWAIWPSKARKRHTRQEVVRAAVVAMRAGPPAAILAAGRAHVAERSARGDEFVKGLAPWLRTGLWQNWTPSVDAASTEPNWTMRLAHFRKTGDWRDMWGPPPNEPGYLGPELAA